MIALIVRNTIYNGGAYHWFDNVREMIFEGNTCIGNEATANGNNIDSYIWWWLQPSYLPSVCDTSSLVSQTAL